MKSEVVMGRSKKKKFAVIARPEDRPYGELLPFPTKADRDAYYEGFKDLGVVLEKYDYY